MLRFLIGIICILLHRPKKLTLTFFHFIMQANLDLWKPIFFSLKLNIIWLKTNSYSKSKKGRLWKMCSIGEFASRNFTVSTYFFSDMIQLLRLCWQDLVLLTNFFGATFQTFQSKKWINMRQKNIWNGMEWNSDELEGMFSSFYWVVVFVFVSVF